VVVAVDQRAVLDSSFHSSIAAQLNILDEAKALPRREKKEVICH